MRSFLLLAALLVQDAQRPVFRASVDLVAIDVVVLDRAGRAVENLGPNDFTVIAGGRPRTLTSAEYLRATRSGRPGTPAELRTPATSGNLSAPGGRSFVFVVDVDRIRAGEGRAVMASISAFVDGLSPSDRVGLVALPDGTPRVDLTVDHELVRKTAERVAGRSTAGRDSAMSLGEADGIRRGDTKALVAYWERTEGRARCLAPGRPIEEPVSVPAACAQLATEEIEPHRTHARTRLDALGALAEALAPAPGPKTLVLVTEGLLHDEDTVDDVRRFAAIAERLGFDGLAEAAHVARGTAFRVIADAAPLLARVDAETSGSYLLAFAPDDEDRRSTDLTIEVRVRREGVDVRARRRATVPAAPLSPAPAPRAGPEERRRLMGELLSRVAPMGEVPIPRHFAPWRMAASNMR